jgi:transposase
VRAVGLDVHLDFCEVAVVEGGEVRSAGRIDSKPEQIDLFAQSLGPDDGVALEVTGKAWEIARILEGHVARVLVVSLLDTGIRQARAKTDRLDARTLAKLLAAGSLDAVWRPDRQTWVMRRRLSRRSQLVRARSRAKNEIHAVLMRQLVGRPPFSDLFGVKGRGWLAKLQLASEERETVDSAMRQIEFLDSEINEVERLIATDALESPEIRRLMGVPGVNVIVAASFLAAIGDTASGIPASSWGISAWTPVFAGQDQGRRPTAISQSRGRSGHATRSLRRAGARSASPGRCTRSMSASAGAADTPSRSSRRPESSRACSGLC